MCHTIALKPWQPMVGNECNVKKTTVEIAHIFHYVIFVYLAAMCSILNEILGANNVGMERVIKVMLGEWSCVVNNPSLREQQ